MLLAIDTSVGTSLAVVADDGSVLLERASTDPMGHAEILGDFFADAALYREQIRAVVVGVGPGPFTGLRVGIAAAKLYAAGAGIPLLPLVSHDAIAAELVAESPELTTIQVRTDARRREAFLSEYRVENGFAIRAAGPMLEPLPDTASNPPTYPASGTSFSGFVSAVHLAKVALHREATGIPFEPADAVYLRSPDITLPNGSKGTAA